MTATELLRDLEQRGVELAVMGDRLRFRPRRAIDETLRDALAQHKTELMTLVRRRSIAAVSVVEKPSQRYEVPAGWSRERWVARLRYLAGICVHPGRAAELTEWADGLEGQGRAT